MKEIIGFQEWIEDDDGWGEYSWHGFGWETEEGADIDENLYELIEVLDEDKHYHPIKALFKLR